MFAIFYSDFMLLQALPVQCYDTVEVLVGQGVAVVKTSYSYVQKFSFWKFWLKKLKGQPSSLG